MFTLEELELMYRLVDEWQDSSANPSRVAELREKIEGMICLRILEGGDEYKFVASVGLPSGDVNIVSRR